MNKKEEREGVSVRRGWSVEGTEGGRKGGW